MLRILLAQDNQNDSSAFRQAFDAVNTPVDILLAPNAKTAWSYLAQPNLELDIVVVDKQLPDISGITLCQNILESDQAVPLMLLVEANEEMAAAEALRAGVHDYLIKDEAQNYLGLLPIVLTRVVQRYQPYREAEATLNDVFRWVEQAKQEWEATVDALPDLVGLIDAQGYIIRANRAVESWQLADVTEVKGQSIHDLLHPNCTTENCYLGISWSQKLTDLEYGQAIEFDQDDVNLNRHLQWQLAPIKTKTGREKLFSFVVQDMTERRLSERALQESLQQTEIAYRQAKIYARQLRSEVAERKRAEASLRQYTVELQARNAELDAFAHTVAHDLKNPLNPIIGYAKFMVDNQEHLPAQQIKEGLESILRGSYRIQKIIDEILLLAGVRKQEAKIEPLDMAQIVNEASERLKSLIEEFQPTIVLPKEWPTAKGYGPWVAEIWTNYLSNGLKYGGSPPHLELGSTKDNNGMIRFWIRDQGPGLTPAEQERLFTPFTRLGQGQVRVEGHGLGLSIVHRISERLGGQVGVESDGPDQGSVFYFTLPEYRE